MMKRPLPPAANNDDDDDDDDDSNKRPNDDDNYNDGGGGGGGDVFYPPFRRPLSPSAHPAATTTTTTTTTLNIPMTRRRAPGSAHHPPGQIIYSSVASAKEERSTSTSAAGAPGYPPDSHDIRPNNSGPLTYNRHNLRRMSSAGGAAVRPSLDGMSRVRNGLRYRLVVLQHPERARMCGFGDKDRRPLSPSLIVKLIVTNEETGQKISPWDVNTSLLFLAADLCHPDDLILAPRNLLVHQHAASVPVSMLAPPPLPPPSQSSSQPQAQQQPPGGPESSEVPPYGRSTTTTTGRSGPPPPPSHYHHQPPPHVDGYHAGQQLHHAGQQLPIASSSSSHPRNPYDVGFSGGSGASLSGASSSSSSALTTVTMEHYTRNLVGAAVTSANVLRDERDEHCIFFVLQDLSVRTEGVYRIRLVFTDLAQQESSPGTHEGVSEALAEAYTEPFTVYSPRRFPGMLEPTELSKKLAAQGIKIAVRSDKKKRRRPSNEADGQVASSSSAAVTTNRQPNNNNNNNEDGEMDELDDDDE